MTKNAKDARYSCLNDKYIAESMIHNYWENYQT